MSNHSSDLDKEMFHKLFESNEQIKTKDDFKKVFLKNNIGATGNFPEGKLTKHDEGEIGFAVGVSENKVIVDFGTPVTWIGLPLETAVELGRLLIKRAKECRR